MCISTRSYCICGTAICYGSCVPQQDHFDMLLVNLRMDSTCVKESMNIKWVSETGIVENIAAVVKDFKETQGLLVSLCSCRLGFV